MTDTLTNIPSLNSLKEELKKAQHPKLFLVDIKNFGHINMKHGDEAGDFILCEFAKALEGFSKDNDMIAFRVENDEFALVKDMPFDLSSMEKLLILVNNFIEKETYTFNETMIKLEANMGICIDQTNLLKKAKKALKLAQKENLPFVTYSEFVNKLLEENEDQVCNLLKEAVVIGTITPFFQKVLDQDEKTVYHETLIRIVNKDSVESPKLFLDIAKKRGFYRKIIQTLIEKLVNIKEVKAINISCEDLYDETLYPLYIEHFKNSGTIFELQNDEFINDDRVIEKIKELRNHNIKICLDNINDTKNIQRLDVDFVKVQGDLVRLLHIDSKAIGTCTKIISTCKELNIKTIASHINSISSFEEVKKLDFDYFQGFLFGEPTSIFAG